MICPCGGATRNKIIKVHNKLIGEYKQCYACGRILWILKPGPKYFKAPQPKQQIEIINEKRELDEKTG